MPRKFFNNGINQDNTQLELKKFNSNNDTLTINFQKFDKSLLVGVSILLIFCGGYASLESESLIYLCIILFLLILCIFYIMFSNRNMILIKEPKTNTLTAKIYNNFGCRKKKKNFNFLKSAQFDIKIIPREKTSFFRLFIFNNLSHLPATDLEKDEYKIKIKPLDLYYNFDDIDQSKTVQEYINELNEFTNSPNDFDSPLFFNANNYISRNESNFPNEKFYNPNQNFISKIMRFSEYFYTYHIRDPNEKFKSHKCRNIVIFIIINSFLIVGMSVIAEFVLEIEEPILRILFSYSILILSGLAVLIIRICLSYRIKRIDCFYSSDLRKIFIGTTIFNEKAYKNSFEFQLNEINKFYVKENNRKTFLSVAVSNNDIDICEISDKADLDKFVLILNEKINKI